MSTDHSLPAAILAIDSLLSVPAIYNIFKHGFRHAAVLGWGYFFIFLSLRIISSGLQLGSSDSSTASLVASIGLSPLLLSMLGLLHEARSYMFDRRNKKTELIWVLALHILITTAVALVASGASAMSKPDTTGDDRAKDKTLVTVGMVLLLLSWVQIALVAGVSFIARPRAGTSGHDDHRQGTRLVYAVLFSVPLIGIRIIVSLVYFATQNQALSPVAGSMGAKVGLGFIEELLVSVAFVVVGVMTRNVGKGRTRQKVSSEQAAWGSQHGLSSVRARA
ncbi:hypothetical protein KJ359_011416 [Pestalotiopsis sp. 9143b]|nr:hypothetical protein KJ359_011416 [Pestalotiopsis sp. 9143b]